MRSDMRSVSDVTVRGLETTFVFFAGMQVNLFKCFCAKIYITVICIKLGDVVHVSASLCMVLCLSKFLFKLPFPAYYNFNLPYVSSNSCSGSK